MVGEGGLTWINGSIYVGCTFAFKDVMVEVWNPKLNRATKFFNRSSVDPFNRFFLSPTGDGSVYASQTFNGVVHFDAGLRDYKNVVVNEQHLYYGFAVPSSKYLCIAYSESPVWAKTFILSVEPSTYKLVKNLTLPTTGGYSWASSMIVDEERSNLIVLASTYGFDPDRWTGILVYSFPSLTLLHQVVICKGQQICLPQSDILLTSKSFYFAVTGAVYQFSRETYTLTSNIKLPTRWNVDQLTDQGLTGNTRYLIGAGIISPPQAGTYSGGLIFLTADE